MIESIISDDQVLENINVLSTQFMQNISNRYRLSHQLLDLKKKQSMQFDKTLNLDLMIDKLVMAIQQVKIKLSQMIQPQRFVQVQKIAEFLQFLDVQAGKFKKTLMLRESQLGSLIFILENQNGQNFEKEYEQNYGELGSFIIKIQDTQKPINVLILEEEIETELQFLQEYSDMIDLMNLNIVHKKYLNDIESLKKNTNKLKIINSKIVTIAEVFPYACIVPTDDLFSFKKTHHRWQKLLENYISYKIYGDKEKIKKSFEALQQNLNVVNATMSIIHQARNLSLAQSKNWGKILSSTNKMLKVAIFKEDAHYEAQVLISEPDGELAKQIWNLPQQAMFRNIISTALPSIEQSQQMWIPRIFGDYLKKKGKFHLPQLVIPDQQMYVKKLFTHHQHEERLQIRLNSPFRIKNNFIKQTMSEKIMKSMTSWFKKANQTPSTVIYHIHGGGFISMSSFIHQTYTRLWANNLKVPIISVDYGKAPQYPFPNGLNDCFQGYMWTLYMFRQIFDIEPKKIILVGDSAGGNLVAALTNLLIEMKLKTPDGIVLVYPALNLNYHNYTPSLLTSLNDMILPHTFLKICLQAYLKQDKQGEHLRPDIDQLISPIQTPDYILQQYPETKIFVGSKDPFHDDCCRFTQKMNQIKPKSALLTIFDEFPHGFLQFDIKTQPHQQCRKATKLVEQALQEML